MNKKGLTLIEVMIASAIGIIVITGLTTAVVHMQLSSKDVSLNGTFRDRVNSIELIMSNKDTCLMGFGTWAAAPPNIPAGPGAATQPFNPAVVDPKDPGAMKPTIYIPKSYNATTRKPIAVLEAGYADDDAKGIIFHAVIVKTSAGSPTIVPGNLKYPAELVLTGIKKSGQSGQINRSMGAPVLTKRIPLFLEVNAANVIQNCYASGADALSSLYVPQIDDYIAPIAFRKSVYSFSNGQPVISNVALGTAKNFPNGSALLLQNDWDWNNYDAYIAAQPPSGYSSVYARVTISGYTNSHHSNRIYLRRETFDPATDSWVKPKPNEDDVFLDPANSPENIGRLGLHQSTPGSMTVFVPWWSENLPIKGALGGVPRQRLIASGESDWPGSQAWPPDAPGTIKTTITFMEVELFGSLSGKIQGFSHGNSNTGSVRAINSGANSDHCFSRGYYSIGNDPNGKAICRLLPHSEWQLWDITDSWNHGHESSWGTRNPPNFRFICPPETPVVTGLGQVYDPNTKLLHAQLHCASTDYQTRAIAQTPNVENDCPIHKDDSQCDISWLGLQNNWSLDCRPGDFVVRVNSLHPANSVVQGRLDCEHVDANMNVTPYSVEKTSTTWTGWGDEQWGWDVWTTDCGPNGLFNGFRMSRNGNNFQVFSECFGSP